MTLHYGGRRLPSIAAKDDPVACPMRRRKDSGTQKPWDTSIEKGQQSRCSPISGRSIIVRVVFITIFLVRVLHSPSPGTEKPGTAARGINGPTKPCQRIGPPWVPPHRWRPKVLLPKFISLSTLQQHIILYLLGSEKLRTCTDSARSNKDLLES